LVDIYILVDLIICEVAICRAINIVGYLVY